MKKSILLGSIVFSTLCCSDLFGVLQGRAAIIHEEVMKRERLQAARNNQPVSEVQKEKKKEKEEELDHNISNEETLRWMREFIEQKDRQDQIYKDSILNLEEILNSKISEFTMQFEKLNQDIVHLQFQNQELKKENINLQNKKEKEKEKGKEKGKEKELDHNTSNEETLRWMREFLEQRDRQDQNYKDSILNLEEILSSKIREFTMQFEKLNKEIAHLQFQNQELKKENIDLQNKIEQHNISIEKQKLDEQKKANDLIQQQLALSTQLEQTRLQEEARRRQERENRINDVKRQIHDCESKISRKERQLRTLHPRMNSDDPQWVKDQYCKEMEILKKAPGEIAALRQQLQSLQSQLNML